MSEKQCTRCKQTLPLESFRAKKDGTYTSGCDSCREKDAKKAQKRREDKRQKLSTISCDETKEKCCALCTKILPLENFRINKGNYNKNCNRCLNRGKNEESPLSSVEDDDEEEKRQCSRCKKKFPLENFKVRGTGYTKNCVFCLQFSADNRKKKMSMPTEPGHKTCMHCLVTKPLEEFNELPNNRGKSAGCTKCCAKMLAYLDKNRCPHGKMNKSACKDCKGTSICEHGKVRTYCPDCAGGSLCEHKKRKDRCKKCKDLYGLHQYCIHGSPKTSCVECGGGSICEHNRRRTRCVDCMGGNVCEHKVIRDCCAYCDPIGYLSRKARKKIGTALHDEILRCEKPIEYLGCTIEEYKKYLEEKFIPPMSWENYGEVWQIDHIVPIKYQEPTLEQVEERLHYSNTQPLWNSDNAVKSNRYISLAGIGGSPKREKSTTT